MKVTYDNVVQILYIYLQEPSPGIAKRTVYIDHGIHLDMDKDDKPLGFEIMLDDSTEEGRYMLLKHFDIGRQ